MDDRAVDGRGEHARGAQLAGIARRRIRGNRDPPRKHPGPKHAAFVIGEAKPRRVSRVQRVPGKRVARRDKHRRAEPRVGEKANAERRARLKHAALAVFNEKSYENATTREIAARAGLGAATLFRYAAEKRDLLFMIVNDDLIAISAQAYAELDIESPLVEGLLTLFAPRFAYFGSSGRRDRDR